MLIKKTGQVKTKDMLDVLDRITLGASGNNDGYALLDDKGDILRTMNGKTFFKKLFKKAVEPWDYLLGHFRFATTGEISQKNIHLWEIDGCHFAHNGWLSNSGTVYGIKTGEADSLTYFRKLIKDIDGKYTDKKIVKAIQQNDDKFYGRCFMTTPRNEVIIWGDFKTYYYKNIVVISSGTLNFSKTLSFGDLMFEKPTGQAIEQEMKGIYKLSGKKFKLLADSIAPDRSYNNYNYNGHNYYSNGLYHERVKDKSSKTLEQNDVEYFKAMEEENERQLAKQGKLGIA